MSFYEITDRCCSCHCLSFAVIMCGYPAHCQKNPLSLLPVVVGACWPILCFEVAFYSLVFVFLFISPRLFLGQYYSAEGIDCLTILKNEQIMCSFSHCAG